MTDPNTNPVTGYPVPPPAPNGYAQPYAAHPPPTYFNVAGNPQTYPTQYHNQQRTIFLRRILTLCIGTIIIIGTITFILWLILRPQLPQFHLQTLTLTNFNLTNTSMISGNWNAELTVRNPNSKITLYYDRLEAAVFYRSDSIAVTTLPPFVQGKKNETAVRAAFASSSEYLDDMSRINGERARGTVEFNLRLVARVRFKAGAWWTRRRILRVYCPDLSVGVSGNSTGGSLTGGSKRCRVGV